MKELDLLIVIRCHVDPMLVVDTYHAAQYNTGPETDVVFAVDGDTPKFSRKMLDLFGKERVYIASHRWGWGAGLFSLLLESYLYFREIYRFNHFQSIDYDTLYIAPEADRMLLDRITSSKIGLLGCHRPSNSHWKKVYEKNAERFVEVFGHPGRAYTHGEGVQGGYMTLTSSLLQNMATRKMFRPPYTVASSYTSIADDHLLPIFVRMCNKEVVDVSDFARCFWKAREDPRGLEEKGYKVFHPTKLNPHNKSRSTEVEMRNYFRKLRGCSDMLK